jgi:hypothetical protein
MSEKRHEALDRRYGLDRRSEDRRVEDDPKLAELLASTGGRRSGYERRATARRIINRRDEG